MEMVSLPMDSSEEERKPICRSSSSSSSSSFLSRRPSYLLLKLPWRDMALLCIGLLSGFLLFHLFFFFPPSSPQKPPRPTLDFFVIGDWGRRGLYNQSQVAIQMGRIGQHLRPSFVVSTGDNFYPKGLKGKLDPDFTTSFTNVYTAPSLQVPWYAVLGNHDYMGDALSQFSIDLSSRDSRWFCRRDFDLHYSLCQDHQACKSSVDFFFIDTNTFVNEYWQPNTTHDFDRRGLAAPRQKQLKLQLQDLSGKLSKSTAKWKLVIGHHTIRSVGNHGDTLELVNQLLPILEHYSVDIYFNGHDHCLQHIKRPDSSVHFFTSGGGSKAFKGLKSYDNSAGVRFVFDGQGFLAVSMSDKSTLLRFYDVFGNVLYSYNLKKGGS